MTPEQRLIFYVSIAILVASLIFFSIRIGIDIGLNRASYTLKAYNGVGSGVYKHGTIVKVVDGRPIVVGNFHDESGKDYPGTVQIEEVK